MTSEGDTNGSEPRITENCEDAVAIQDLASALAQSREGRTAHGHT